VDGGRRRCSAGKAGAGYKKRLSTPYTDTYWGTKKKSSQNNSDENEENYKGS